MDGEMNTLNQSIKTETSHAGLNIMVVDDDVVSLAVVAAILRSWKHQVVTVTNAKDALLTLQTRRDFFQLVVSDVHMPEIDGFEFQKQVHQEFQLPVVMISADDKESSILRGLESGAVFYIVKPVKYDDLKDLWQYAISPRRGRSVVIREIENTQGASKTSNDVDIRSGSRKKNKRDTNKKAPENIIEGNEKETSKVLGPRKAKLVWTTTLHNRFLEAIRTIGIERVVPKKIFKLMNVPGITRENVASHLQKYRIFLKRVMETSNPDGSISAKNLLKSSFADQDFPQFLHQKKVGSSWQSGFEGNIQSATIFSNHQALNRNRRPQLGFGQSDSMNNQVYLHQPAFGDIHALYQANDAGINGTSSMQMYRQQTNNFNTFEGHSSNNIHGIHNIGSFSNSNMTPRSSFSSKIYSSGQMEFVGGKVSNDFNGRYGLMNENSRYMTLALMGNVNPDYYAPGASSSRFQDVIEQQNNPMLLPPCPLPQQNNLINRGENTHFLNHAMNNTTSMEKASLPQFFASDIDDFFLNQLNHPSYDEMKQQGVEEVQNHDRGIINSNPDAENPPQKQQSSNQIFLQGVNDDIMDSKFGPGMN